MFLPSELWVRILPGVLMSDYWYVYIVECSDKTYYTGISKDVDARVAKHNKGAGAKYTKKRLPVILKYIEYADSHSKAAKREYEIKQLTRPQKECLMREDPRKIGLKNGLRQLTIEQLQKVITYPGEMILDEFNYADGKFCPLAIALGLDKSLKNPTHEKVFKTLNDMGYKVNNTQGIKGEFYTTNRKADLLDAANEVLLEKLK